MSGVIEARQRLDSQLQENELVLKVRLLSSDFYLSQPTSNLYIPGLRATDPRSTG
jgi:hypothetical protein